MEIIQINEIHFKKAYGFDVIAANQYQIRHVNTWAYILLPIQK